MKGLLPDVYRKQIHRSLVSKWKRESPDELMKKISEDQRLLRTIRAFYRINKTLKDIIGTGKDYLKRIRQFKHQIVDTNQFDKNYKGLYNWRRHVRTRAALTSGQIEKLESIGFELKFAPAQIDNFDKRLEQLKAYAQVNNSIVVKKRETSLYNWLRDVKKRPRLTQEQANKLALIGFDIRSIPTKG